MLKVDLYDDKIKQKAMKTVSVISGMKFQHLRYKIYVLLKKMFFLLEIVFHDFLSKFY